MERGLGLQEPLRENFSSSAGAFAILLCPCFQEFQRNSSCNRCVVFGFVLEIELLVSGFRDLARRLDVRGIAILRIADVCCGQLRSIPTGYDVEMPPKTHPK